MRSVWGANRFINKQIKYRIHFPTGRCKQKCREAYDIPSDGSGTAREAWHRTTHRFRKYWVPGAFVWWQNEDAWHVAICQYRKGHIWTTDLEGNGYWCAAKLTDVHEKWPNCEFLGFTLDIDGKTPVRMPTIRRSYP